MADLLGTARTNCYLHDHVYSLSNLIGQVEIVDMSSNNSGIRIPSITLIPVLLLPEPTQCPLNASFSIKGGYYSADIDKRIPSRVQSSITRAGQEVVVLFSHFLLRLYSTSLRGAMSPECRETSISAMYYLKTPRCCGKGEMLSGR
jgi:hypothetical protein